ncbi:alpha-N-arabinofuranosidase [Asticcacaulis machinosus]|uniref:non-reducing end alpha-L-arabinofuranosidase n=1 Tax=Asticcacaulis machinosus TaxID=2984211 RepID=A0ABT5HM62_9CAUL|nr:alpha-N-arabinofuranosidase [Asticcacaulis machinosus]MDC7677308.1 alpha-N-arabinofuranosidase [Asticcacaulis machinosus]
MLKSFTALALTVTVAFAPLVANAQTTTTIEASLKADKPGPEISRYVYGQFSEHLGLGVYDGIWVGENSSIPNTRGIRNDVVAALKAIKMPVVRWPGGCFADEYIWRDGIGERAKRPVRKNNWWGGTPEDNQFGTHEFMDFVEQVGSEAYFSVNVGSSNPTEMREWIEYLTSPGDDTLAKERRANGRDKPFKVPFIGIGNESWGCGGNMTPEYYANELRRFESFYHKGTDNPGVRVASGANSFDVNWTDVVMKNAARHMDAISLHYYTIPTGNWTTKGVATAFPTAEWNATFYQTMRMDDLLKKHIAVMDKHDPKKRIALYVDEWGTWYDVEKGTNPGHLYQQNTLRDGVLAAANFNIFHNYTDRVKMTNIAQTINVLQAMILTDKEKMALTPTYYAFKMYVPFQDSIPLPVEVTAPTLSAGKDKDGKDQTFPAFNVTAAKARDGKTYVGVANMDADKGYKINIDLGTLKAKKVSGDVLTAAKLDAHNVPGQKEAIFPVAYKGGKISGGKLTLDVPAKSVVVVAVE